MSDRMKTDSTTLPPLPNSKNVSAAPIRGRDSPDMESTRETRTQLKKRPQTIHDFLPPGAPDTQPSSTTEPIKPILQLYPIRTVVVDGTLIRTGSSRGSGSVVSLAPSKSSASDNLSGLDSFSNSFNGKAAGVRWLHVAPVSESSDTTTDQYVNSGSKQSVSTSVSGLSTSFNGSMLRSMGALRDPNVSPPHVHFLNPAEGSQDIIPTTVSYQTEFKDHVAELSDQALVGTSHGSTLPAPFEKNGSRVSSRRSSIVAMQPPDGRKMVVTSRRNSLAPSWHSKGRRRSNSSIKSSGSASVHTEGVGFDREVLPSEYNLNQLPAEPSIPHINSDYYDYVRLSQKVGSLNFIQKLDSTEVLWTNRTKKVKLIGRYLIGEQIGKGSFGKPARLGCIGLIQYSPTNDN